MTPPIPQWIRERQIPGYTNALTWFPTETRLYGTEDLYGDWNGRILLLAKDFAPAQFIRNRLELESDSQPYRHEPGLRTNRRLRRYAQRFAESDDPLTCGMLYGSALACLLRDDNRWSGSLPSRAVAFEFGSLVLKFTLNHMPRLRAIMCLGDEAWRCVMGAIGADYSWKEVKASASPLIELQRLTCVAGYHPAARVSNVEMGRAWNVLSEVLGQHRVPLHT